MMNRGRLTFDSLPDFLAFHRVMQGYSYRGPLQDYQLYPWDHEVQRKPPSLYILFDYFKVYGVDFADWAQFHRIYETPAHAYTLAWADEMNTKLKTLGDNPFPRGYPRTLETWGSFVQCHKGETSDSELARRTGVYRTYFTPSRLKGNSNFNVKALLSILNVFGKTVFDWMAWEIPEDNPLEKKRVKPKKKPKNKGYRRGMSPSKDHPWNQAIRAEVRQAKQRASLADWPRAG